MAALVDRPIASRFQSRRMREGAGFVVRRPIGGHELSDEDADPFLLLDELGPVNYAPGEFPGAPWHPHRGFDTVMYLKAGEGRHSDSMGNTGILRAGDCQWMTAASGIIHDEGKDHPGGLLHGFQMWVNLPKAHKMDPPSYQDVPAARIPLIAPAPGVSAKIIAGECGGTKAVVQTISKIQYIDFELKDGASFTHAIPPELDTVILYPYEGAGTVGSGPNPARISDGDSLLMGPGDAVTFSAAGPLGLKMLLLAGKKLREPIVRHGPFVMNSKQEIMQAFREYQEGTFVKQKGTAAKFD